MTTIAKDLNLRPVDYISQSWGLDYNLKTRIGYGRRFYQTKALSGDYQQEYSLNESAEAVIKSLKVLYCNKSLDPDIISKVMQEQQLNAAKRMVYNLQNLYRGDLQLSGWGLITIIKRIALLIADYFSGTAAIKKELDEFGDFLHTLETTAHPLDSSYQASTNG